MFQINKSYCCKTEEQLLYNIMELMTELNARLGAQGPAGAPPPAKAAPKRAGRTKQADSETGS